MTHPTPIAMQADPTTDAGNDDQDSGPDAPSMGLLHNIFEAWSAWSYTRKYYCPPARSGTILGQLRTKSRPYAHAAPDAPCSADLAALHLAILGQSRDALDTRVFYAYYGARARNIKISAYEMGISRRHFYRLLKEFCQRVYGISLTIAASNITQRDALAHYIPGAPIYPSAD